MISANFWRCDVKNWRIFYVHVTKQWLQKLVEIFDQYLHQKLVEILTNFRRLNKFAAKSNFLTSKFRGSDILNQ